MVLLLFYILGKLDIGQKTPSSTCYILSTIYAAAYKYRKGIYRRLLLLFGKPFTWLAYLLSFLSLSLPLLAGAPLYNKTAVRPAAVRTIQRETWNECYITKILRWGAREVVRPRLCTYIRKFFFRRVVASENQGLWNLCKSQFYCNFIAILSRFWRFWRFAAIYTVAYIFTANCCKLLKSPKLP